MSDVATLENLLRRDVHPVDLLGRLHHEALAFAGLDALLQEVVVGVEQGVRLRDDVVVFRVGRQVFDLRADERRATWIIAVALARQLLRERLGDQRARRQLGVDVLAQVAADPLRRVGRQLLDHAAVRRLDEAVAVDDAVRRERADQADVRAFRRLDRADAAVVAVVHVAHVEAGAVARETAGTQRREPALVRQLGQRVRLVHELRELRAAEELLHRRDDRADVDQRARRRLVRVDDRHALAHDALHAQQADAELVLDQLADGAHAAVAQVVDVVRVADAVVELDLRADDRLEVARLQDADLLVGRRVRAGGSSL